MSEFQRWNDRYSVPDYIFGTAPNHFLEAAAPLLPTSGRALAVADGEGRNGVWLAARGLDVLSLDFSPAARAKAEALAAERGVTLAFETADVHGWDYPDAAFELVIDIFTQFSSPEERERKWAGMLRALKPGGLLVLQGYTPKQLDYGTGGPKILENLYTRELLETAFGELRDVAITEEECEMDEGPGHSGMSAVIGLTGRK